ncbi:MAG: SusC/RagA family TonB-linked outer membrane protein, partial [Mangrovibacterium sp.]|nr:SusC/RagA family TonB-linked outer membrane protein [Mangrovibacterium sp.]
MKKKRSDVFPGRECILKIIRVMKLVSFLLLVCFLKVSANSYSQTVHIKLSLQNIPLSEALKEIQKQTEFTFFYSVEDIREVKVSRIEFKKATLEEALDACLQGTDLSYEIAHKGVIIKRNEKPVRQQSEEKEVIAQKNVVKGKVSDGEGHPLPGVTITIVGTTRGVITDNDGTYSIEAEPRDKLVFSFIGMESQIIDVGNQKTINVRMKEKVDELEEVTVVAFGKQKKESVISSIETIKSDELRVPSSNLTQAFSGRMAGVISYQTSGEPGQDDAQFFIRGISSFGTGKVDPLILIDNVEVSKHDLSRLHPDDIASFSILKDATATALYGARGANGVVMISTKEGKEGATKITVRLENSFSAPTQKIEMADPITYMEMANEAYQTRDPLASIPYSYSKIDNTKRNTNEIVYPTVDWMDLLTKDVTMNQRVNLNISGGGQIARYYIAGSLSQDNGILKVDKRNDFNS